MYISRKILAKRRESQAFTILEVVLAILILALLVSVLYAIVDTTLRSASELEEIQNRNRETTAFLALCRKTFHDMPGTMTFEARVVPDGRRYSSELIFRNAPGLMWWGDAKNASLSTILGVRGQVGGLVGIGILQDSEDEIDSYIKGGTASRPWLMLLPDLRDAEWQFLDAGSTSWVRQWTATMRRPAYARLRLTDAEGTRSYIFEVPPVVKAQ